MMVLNAEPSPVSILNVLFAVYQAVESTPRTEVVFAEVNLPSSSTIKTGI